MTEITTFLPALNRYGDADIAINNEIGYLVKYEDHAAIVAELNEKMESAQKRIAELEANDRIKQHLIDGLLKRAIEAEEELARRDAAKAEPVAWQFYDDGNWYNGVNNNGHRRNTEKAGYRVRDLYPAPQPATLPNELDNDSEFIAPYRAGYNKAISDARELGCKPAPVVVLPSERTSDGVAYGVSGTFTMGKSFGFNEGLALSREALEAAGIKWRAAE